MILYPGDRKAQSVDIALILESSYPYILGGVSTWVEQIIKSFPNYTFAVIFLGGAPEHYKEGIRYELPPNLTHLQVHYLFDEDVSPEFMRAADYTPNPESMMTMHTVHKAFRCRHKEAMNEIGNLSLYQKGSGVDYEEFLYGEASWDFLTQAYSEHCGDTSFIDYFWTIRNIHKPLWKLANMVDFFPKARLVHSASTGYAGLLSFLINRHYQIPVILSEHGIYTRERRIDVFLSKNFRDDYVIDRPLSEQSYLRDLWDRYFKTLSQLCYNIASPIVSLSKMANEIQIEEGADAQKTMIIPNGVDIEQFEILRRSFDEKLDVVCFVGRIVPMKDVKGFIRAVPKVHSQVEEAQFWIIGSIDQDPQYAAECHALVENISLQDIVTFQLHQRMSDVLPQVKVLVLNAIREGMPFIILESFAAGIPVVATDVGACKEMVLGGSDEDQAIGPAGIVVRVADTEALEQAIIELLTNKPLWEQMSQAAIVRAQRYYDQNVIMEHYGTLYKERMRSWQE